MGTADKVTIKIESDGTLAGTYIMTSDNKVIENIDFIQLWIGIDQVSSELVLGIKGAPIKIKTENFRIEETE